MRVIRWNAIYWTIFIGTTEISLIHIRDGAHGCAFAAQKPLKALPKPNWFDSVPS
jgi:hypothetical protein